MMNFTMRGGLTGIPITYLALRHSVSNNLIHELERKAYGAKEPKLVSAAEENR
ncbi:hypothetical protein IEN85_10480 [Pelagicoccus sp. NFK12]|uniref:Uncharacterized protein n=1 Tax=Pelagicoccus enzymogenes TaxID=2773457 RepID=A0A927F8Q8_9BACT|nr:hypothetical protein [Pelagicoccus enzymogenes]MBD5779914.1 hypothetical protein [Pelagicoccus enzymogenes]